MKSTRWTILLSLALSLAAMTGAKAADTTASPHPSRRPSRSTRTTSPTSAKARPSRGPDAFSHTSRDDVAGADRGRQDLEPEPGCGRFVSRRQFLQHLLPRLNVGVRDNVRTDATRLAASGKVSLDLFKWSSVQSQYDRINRTESGDDDALMLDAYWVESKP